MRRRVKGKGSLGMFPTRGPWMRGRPRILLDRRPAWADDWIACNWTQKSRVGDGSSPVALERLSGN